MATEPTPGLEPKAAKERILASWFLFLAGAALFGPLGPCLVSNPRGLALVSFVGGLVGQYSALTQMGDRLRGLR
jgi:hypothetical protein